jgi:hypothetical protein
MSNTYANIITGALADSLPASIEVGGFRTNGATEQQCFEAGWRRVVETEAPDAGCVVTRWRVDELDGETCRLLIDEQRNPQSDKIASLTAEIVFLAQAFRIALRRNFGAGAETNQAVTAQAVTAHFLALTAAGTMTPTQIADAMLLANLFPRLSEWNGAGETWTLPWAQIPEVVA